MKQTISITAISSISPLGISLEEVWREYLKTDHLFVKREFGASQEWVAPLSEKSIMEIEYLKLSDSKYRNLDNSVLFAMYASRNAIKAAAWSTGENFGINIGSSRGATSLFEKYHEEYIRTKNTSTFASPTSTLGNISSWVAHDLKSQGPEISHSITCSTALHALLNGVAWIKSGMTNKFLVGGSEAALTPFTIAQMKALKVYSRSNDAYPCRSADTEKSQNTMILGEGASIACLENGIVEKALAIIEGVGYATEVLEHTVSISADAHCFQRSMKMALGKTDTSQIDVIVMHTPGTIKGDLSEIKAIQKVFGTELPALTTNKWKVGHSFGASGMLSIELAILMLKHQKFIKVPFVEYAETPNKIEKVMVNAVGFGGNAVSILLRRSH